MKSSKILFEQFRMELSEWTSADVQEVSEVSGVVLFGSTTHELIKSEADVDLLYILDSASEDRSFLKKICHKLDGKLDQRLKKIPGRNLIASSIVKRELDLCQLSPVYLDFPEKCQIVFDRAGVAASLIEDIKNWIQENQAYRVQRGNLWYWIYDNKDPNLPVDFTFARFKSKST